MANLILFSLFLPSPSRALESIEARRRSLAADNVRRRLIFSRSRRQRLTACRQPFRIKIQRSFYVMYLFILLFVSAKPRAEKNVMLARKAVHARARTLPS